MPFFFVAFQNLLGLLGLGRETSLAGPTAADIAMALIPLSAMSTFSGAAPGILALWFVAIRDLELAQAQAAVLFQALALAAAASYLISTFATSPTWLLLASLVPVMMIPGMRRFVFREHFRNDPE